MESYLNNFEIIFPNKKYAYSSDKIKEINHSKILNDEKDKIKEEAFYRKGNYLIKNIIGLGTFGKVKLGIYIPTKEKVAIKIIEKSKLENKGDIIRLKRELEIIVKFNHPNLVKVKDILEDKNNYYIIMDYCEGGELFKYVVKKGYLSEKESSFYFYQLINGLEYIHSLGIVHRDLKPENILLTKNHILKIIDFGLSNYFKKGNLLNTPCGSPCYASPEMIIRDNYDGTKIDIWCCGIILYIMLSGYFPFNFNNNDDMFNQIIDCDIEYPNYFSNIAVDLLKKIIVPNPKKRINIEQIKNHPFYKKGKYYFIKDYINLPKDNENNQRNVNNKISFKQLNNNDLNKNLVKDKININNNKDLINIYTSPNQTSNILNKKYRIDWDNFRIKPKKHNTKNYILAFDKDEYFQKNNVNNTFQYNNKPINNNIIKLQVNALNIINNKIIISPKTIENKNRISITNNNSIKFKGKNKGINLNELHKKLLKNKTNMISKLKNKNKDNKNLSIKNRKENTYIHGTETIFNRKRKKKKSLIKYISLRINPNNNNNKISGDYNLSSTINSINENNNKNQKTKMYYFTRHQSNKYTKLSLYKNRNYKYNLNNNSIETNKNHNLIRNSNITLFNELSNNLSNTIDNSIHTGNKMKKQILSSLANKNQIMININDRNNAISEDKLKSIKYNSNTNSQTKQNIIFKKIQLKNRKENLYFKYKGNKYNLKKNDKINKKYLNHDIIYNMLNKKISDSEIIKNKILNNNNSLDYKINSNKSKDFELKNKLNKKKTANIFYSKNDFTIDKHIFQTKNKNLNNIIYSQKTFDKKNNNSKIKNVNKTIVNKKYSTKELLYNNKKDIIIS